MPIKKFVTALTAGSLVCLAVLGLRSPATAQTTRRLRPVRSPRPLPCCFHQGAARSKVE